MRSPRASARRQAKLARNDQTLNLRRAGIQPTADGIAQVLLNLVLAHEAIAAVHLDCVQRREHRGFTDEEFGHRTIECRFAASLLSPRRSVEERSSGLEAQLHVGNPG